MLKRAAVFVALAMFISMVSMIDAHAEARGPKIFGLQVGMPWEEAVQIAREYAAKKGLEVLGKKQVVVGLLQSGNPNIGAFTYTDGQMELSNNNTPYLSKMKFFARTFNIKKFDDEKLQTLCNSYRIPFDELTPFSTGFYSGSKYINSKDGYIVLIYAGDTLEVEAIEKTSDMIME